MENLKTNDSIVLNVKVVFDKEEFREAAKEIIINENVGNIDVEKVTETLIKKLKDNVRIGFMR